LEDVATLCANIYVCGRPSNAHALHTSMLNPPSVIAALAGCK